MLEALERDAARYRDAGGWWRNLGFWAVAAYRLSVWARGTPIPGLRQLLIALTWLLKLPFRILLHLELPSRASIGPGFALFHPYNVLVGPGTEIGEECSVYHEVTLGSDAEQRMPKLGSHVVLFAGSRVLGNVTIGDRSEIGANCVVMRNIPAYSVVVTALPRVVPQALVRRFAVRPKEEDAV